MMKLIAYLFILFSHFSWGLPLSEDAIKKAKKIVILSGTFDPWSKADQAYADGLIKSGEADLVIVSPSHADGKYIPLPLENRIELMDEALKAHPSIAYPSGDWAQSAVSSQKLAERIRKISDVKIEVRKNPVPSVDLRAYLVEHSEAYFKPEANVGHPDYDQKVFDRILKSGFYMGERPGMGPMMVKFTEGLRTVGIKLGVFNRLQHAYKSLKANRDLKEFEMDGKRVEISKFLGAGAQGDAYLTVVDGQKIVLKVAKDNQSARAIMQNSVLTHQWLRKTSTINVPELLAFDPEGKWISMDFAKGIQLDQLIADNGGKIPPETEVKLKAFYEEALRISRENNMILDINTQNIFVQPDGKLTLVDFGALSPGKKIAPTFEAIRALWLVDGKILMGKASPSVGGKCIRSVLRNFLSGV